MLKKLTGLTAIAGLFVMGSASAGIENSAHDFSGLGFASGTNGEICVVCHAPHNNQNDQGSLLWNHDGSSWAAGDYTLYDSTTLEQDATAPGDVSLLCLSCHDGSVAVDSYGGSTGGGFFVDNAIFTNGTGANGSPKMGRDLGNDHPIGLVYASGTATSALDSEMFPTSTTVTFADSSTGTIENMLFSREVECASCHDVHDTVSNGGDYLLVVSNANSDLCLTCHDK